MEVSLSFSIAAKFARMLTKRMTCPDPYTWAKATQLVPLFCRLAATILLTAASNWAPLSSFTFTVKTSRMSPGACAAADAAKHRHAARAHTVLRNIGTPPQRNLRFELAFGPKA